MTHCARCHKNIDGDELYSTVLKAPFCGYACYDAEWRERFGPGAEAQRLLLQEEPDDYAREEREEADETPEGRIIQP